MDDMKRLIEKYRQELMEYQRVSAPQKPLVFPEMLSEDDSAATQTADNNPPDNSSEQPAAELPQEPAGSPQESTEQQQESAEPPQETTEPPAAVPKEIIGYSDSESGLDFDRIMAELSGQSSPQYNEIDSIKQTRSDITESSVPEGNVEFNRPIEPNTDNSPTQERPESTEPLQTTPEEVEQLAKQPVSGTDIDEQLGRRSFEDTSTPKNSRDDIRPLYTESTTQSTFPEQTYENYKDFSETKNPHRGSLRFRVYTARGALPVEGALCEVFVTIAGKPYLLYSLKTDSSGQTMEISLPAPSKELSQKPDSPVQPYALYNAKVSSDGFTTVVLKNIPIFEGILSVQRVGLVPGNSSGSETIEEQEPDLQ